MIFYSHTTGGFYNSSIHGSNIPEDAREITAAVYAQLLQEQSQGRVITLDPLGRPITIERPITTDDLIHDAKNLRDSHINSPITVFGVQWQIDASARENMRDAIDYATRTDQMSAQRGWILADNSSRATTATELQQVMDAYVQRMDTTFAAYALWRGGDKTTAFLIDG